MSWDITKLTIAKDLGIANKWFFFTYEFDQPTPQKNWRHIFHTKFYEDLWIISLNQGTPNFHCSRNWQHQNHIWALVKNRDSLITFASVTECIPGMWLSSIDSRWLWCVRHSLVRSSFWLSKAISLFPLRFWCRRQNPFELVWTERDLLWSVEWLSQEAR